jgi:hypothetical protein
VKQPEEMDQFDKAFKTMNHKLNMTEGEQKDVLYQINNKINSKKQRPKQAFTHWKYYFTLASAALILILLAMPLLNNNESKSEEPGVSQGTQEEDIQAIESVLQNALTGPNEELDKIMEKKEWIEELSQYEENLYRKFFANDTSYMEFVNNYGATLMIEPRRNNYKLKVKNIDYEKTDSAEIIYNFSVELEYQKEGSEKSEVEVVTGQANLNEEHKIEAMLIRMNDFLGSLGK